MGNVIQRIIIFGLYYISMADQEIGDPLSIFYINNIQAVYDLTDRLGGKEAWRPTHFL